MIIGNLLNMALSVIGSTTVDWYPATGRAKSTTGLWIVQFGSPICVSGSFQVMSYSMIVHLGLDMKKEYMNFYVPELIRDLERDISGDQIGFCGKRYQVMANENWLDIAGWNQTVAVKITP